jgi:GTP-binding protein
MLRKSGKRLLCIHKADNFELGHQICRILLLGLGDPFSVSAVNGLGTGDLLDRILSLFSKQSEEEPWPISEVCSVGRPNAGKSSMINALIGEDRNIVTDIAGTRATLFIPDTTNSGWILSD